MNRVFRIIWNGAKGHWAVASELAKGVGKSAATGTPVPDLQLQAPEFARAKGLQACVAVALLAVLQREGRLVDFLREDIANFSDAQVGAAARAIHASCRKVLDEHLVLEPVRTEDEGARIVVPTGFDPSTIRLTGKVGGKPPFRGVLRHRGWRTQELELPADAAGQDPSIIAPAEVEIT